MAKKLQQLVKNEGTNFMAKLSAPARLVCLFFKAAALDGFWNKSQVSPNEFSKQLSSSGVSNC